MISDLEFIHVWENSDSRQEVATKCGMSGAAVGMRASKLRKSGFKLKNFQAGRPKKFIEQSL